MSFKRKKTTADTPSQTPSSSSPQSKTPVKSPTVKTSTAKTSTTPKKTATKTTPLKKSTGSPSSVAGKKRKTPEVLESPASKQAKSEASSVKPPGPPSGESGLLPGGGTLTFKYDALTTVRQGGEEAFLNATFSQLLGKDDRRGTEFVKKHGRSDPRAVQWLMRAVCVYAENLVLIEGIGLTSAKIVPRLIKAAENPARTEFSSLNRHFEVRMAYVVGFTRHQFRQGLPRPSADQVQTLESIYFPGGRPSRPARKTVSKVSTTRKTTSTVSTTKKTASTLGPFNSRKLKPLLKAGLEEILDNQIKNYSLGDTQPLDGVKPIAEFIQGWVVDRFAVPVLASIDSPYHKGFSYRDMVVSSLSVPVGRAEQMGWLRNRSDVVGRDEMRGSPYKQTNYDPGRDRPARDEILAELLTSSAFEAKVTMALRLTPSQSHVTGQIAMQPYFPPWGERTDHLWERSRTLIHELLHFLTHSAYNKAASGIPYRQVMDEGITELLTVHMFTKLVEEAATNAKTRQKILGLRPFARPSQDLLTVRYGDAGKQALEVEKAVGLPNVQAAYFMGYTSYIGVSQPKKVRT